MAITRDYGHKPYMQGDDYAESMKRPADKAYDNLTKRPHSDDKKPYFPDEYPEMENFWTPYDPPLFPPIPPIVPDDPTYPPIVPDRENPDEPDLPHEFTGCMFTVPQGPKFLKEGQRTWSAIGVELNDPLVRIRVEFGPIKVTTGVQWVNQCMASLIPNCFVQVKALEDIDPEQYQADGDYYPSQIVATTASGNKCWFACWVSKCPPDIDLTWDDENNPTVVNAGNSAFLYVLGGAPPFIWTVSGGDGFSLAQSKTKIRSNTLFLTPQACGTAVITVTDACDNVVTGHVRSNNGQWVLSETVCTCITGAGGCCEAHGGSDCIVGHLKYIIGSGHSCYISGRMASCSWLGGCFPSGAGGCSGICDGTQIWPCCNRDSGYLCDTCLEILHNTIYRVEMEVYTWECLS